MTRRRPLWVQNNNTYLKREEAERLGFRSRDGNLHEEMAAVDKLPPLVRQHLNESQFEWSAVTVLQALETVAKANPFQSPEKHAADLVLWLYDQEQAALAKLEAERFGSNDEKPPSP